MTALLVIAAIAGTGALGWAIADETQNATARDPHPLTIAVNAGRHVRIDGPHGPVHVWIPPSYRADTGATIVYVHGYYDNADTAYIGHRLPEQFAMSALNAVFVVPEAPAATKVPVNYPSLGALIQLVEDNANVQRGMALTAVVGHSGASRTIAAWLDEPLVDQVVLIDAMYANDDKIEAWYRASPTHRFITVGQDTLMWNEQLARALSDIVTIDLIPPTYDTWPREARTARAVYVRSQFAHMPLVTNGIVLPSLLRLLAVELLPDAPWQHRLGDLPAVPSASATTAPGR